MIFIEDKRVEILREYKLYNILYDDKSALNESNFIQDLLAGTESERADIKNYFKKLKTIVPDLMLKIVKLGGKIALNGLSKAVRECYKLTKSYPKATRKLVIGLVSILVSLGAVSIVKSYNNHPVFPESEVEIIEVDDLTGIVYTELSEDYSTECVYDTTTNELSYKENNKVLNIPSKNNAPIYLLKSGENKSSYYDVSDVMCDALMAVEDFKPYIYDAKNPNRKLTDADMKNMKADLTIGYGHKLTPAERKSWKINKKVSHQEAKMLFKEDLAEKVSIMNKKLKTLPYDNRVEYSQGFIDGFASLLFNMGPGNMFGNDTKKESEFWRRLKNCRIDKKADKMNTEDLNYALAQVNKQNVTMNGHKVRRKAEYNIMNQGIGELDKELYKLKI